MIIDVLLIIAISAFIVTFVASAIRESRKRKNADKEPDKTKKEE